MSHTPARRSSSCEFGSSRSDHTISELEETKDISSSPQLETFCPGPNSLHPQTDFVGFRVAHDPEEVRDMNDLRAGLLRRHRKRLYDLIDLAPPLAKRTYLKRGEEDPAPEAPASTATRPDEAGISATSATLLDTIGSSATATVQANAPGPSSMAAAQSGTTAFGDAPAAVETHGSEGVLDASNNEEVPDEKSSPTTTVPSSWEKLMEMLKGMSCFTDAEAPSTRMSDFFPLTKGISMNMGGDPPAFFKARFPFGTPESAVSCIQHLQEWTIPKTAEVVITSVLFFSSFLAVATFPHNIIFCFVVTLPRL